MKKVILRFSFVLSTLCLLTSCSSKMAYRFLDWAIFWQVGQYVTLDSAQKRYAKDKVAAFHAWHRREELPRYAQYLRGLSQRLLQEDLTREQVHAETDAMQALLDASFARLLPTATQVMHTFSDEQVTVFLDKLKKERKDYQKKHIDVSDEKRFQLRQDELVRYLKRGIGKFTKEQKQWLVKWSKDLLPYEALTLKQQEQWAEQMAQTLANRSDKIQLDKKLRTLMLYRTDGWDAELEKILDVNQDITYAFLARLFKNLTPKQEKKLVTRFNQYADDFDALSKE